MRLDSSCPEVRWMNFGRTEGVETVAKRIRAACLCSACYELAKRVREGGRRWLDANLRRSGEKETEK
jgi:hypothetical protein